MKIVGFNFNKISVEKFIDTSKNLKINTKIDISDIKEAKADAFKMKEDLLGVKFNYEIDYEPNFAKIEMVGNVLLALEPKTAREVLRQWKDKKIPSDFRMVLFNVILRKSNIRALQLEEEMNLPLHIPMPSLREQDKQEGKK